MSNWMITYWATNQRGHRLTFTKVVSASTIMAALDKFFHENPDVLGNDIISCFYIFPPRN